MYPPGLDSLMYPPKHPKNGPRAFTAPAMTANAWTGDTVSYPDGAVYTLQADGRWTCTTQAAKKQAA